MDSRPLQHILLALLLAAYATLLRTLYIEAIQSLVFLDATLAVWGIPVG